MRTLSIERSALKELAELPAKHYRQVVSAIFDLLHEPTPHFSKTLSGSSYLRLAVGEYRVVYRFDDQSVQIIVFGKRNDDEIYRKLNRKS